MAKIRYQDINLKPASLAIVSTANAIIEEYQGQGFDLTLRQLYYQFVARDIIENKQSEYKRLGSIINDARLAGLIGWEAIVDRTRNLQRLSHWQSPASIVEACSQQYRVDKWATQKNRVEVWIEKDALVGVVERVCNELDVPYFSCRGYTSQSEMWVASQRLKQYEEDNQSPVIIHLGDHDPSGIDMTRDIEDRLELFMGGVEMRRIALNMDQVRKYNPPPNPTKLTDSRCKPYIKKFGGESWELDALDPRTLSKLIKDTVLHYRDQDEWDMQVSFEQYGKKALRKAVDFLEEQA